MRSSTFDRLRMALRKLEEAHRILDDAAGNERAADQVDWGNIGSIAHLKKSIEEVIGGEEPGAGLKGWIEAELDKGIISG